MKPVYLPTVWIDIPPETSARLARMAERHAAAMLVVPTLTPIKTVVEVDRTDYPHIILRQLFSAFYATPEQVLNADNVYKEVWMAVLQGRPEQRGFAITDEELYVRQQGGWMLVNQLFTPSSPNPVASRDGDAWPEPATEPSEAPGKFAKQKTRLRVRGVG